jgi:hypothetical protein
LEAARFPCEALVRFGNVVAYLWLAGSAVILEIFGVLTVSSIRPGLPVCYSLRKIFSEAEL